jgi:receptor-type tyrosine-protein phosphatase gamma
VEVLDVTSTTIKISWIEPEKPNGVIHAYRVYYMFSNQTLLHLPMLRNDASASSPFRYTLINLSEFHIAILYKAKPYTQHT